MKKYLITVLLIICSHFIWAQDIHRLSPAPPPVHVIDCGTLSWYKQQNGVITTKEWPYKISWSQFVSDLCKTIASYTGGSEITQSDFEANYTLDPSYPGYPVMATMYLGAEQYTSDNGRYSKVDMTNTRGCFTINPQNGNQSDLILTWEISPYEAYQYFVTKKETSITRYIQFYSSSPTKYPTIFVSFTLNVKGYAEIGIDGMTTTEKQLQQQLDNIRRGDMNEDGTVSIEDITDLVNKVLKK